MTDLFIVLAAVTVICTGAALPCFFKSSRFIAGCLILSLAVLCAAAACFTTPVITCLKSLGEFDIWYYSILFGVALITSIFYRFLSGIIIFLYILWCSVFLIFLLPAGYSPSKSIGEVTVSSADEEFLELEKVTLSPYQLLPFRMIWYKSPQKSDASAPGDLAMRILTGTGTKFSSEIFELPHSATYPHVYSLIKDTNGSPSAETIF